MTAKPPPATPLSVKGLRSKGLKPNSARPQSAASRRRPARSEFVDPDQAGLDLRQETAKAPSINLISLMVAGLAGLLLALTPYCVMALPNIIGPLLVNANIGSDAPTGYSVAFMTPFLPVAAFIGGLLGWRLGGGVVAVFLVAGFCGMPLFADGGGWDYVSRPGFGYLIGALVSAGVAGVLLSSRSQAREGNVLYAARAIVSGIIAMAVAHGCGLIGLTVQFLIGVMSFTDLGQWAVQLSAMPVVYDALFTAAWLGLVRPLRMIFWLVMY